MIKISASRPLNTAGRQKGSDIEEPLVVGKQLDMIVAGTFLTYDNIETQHAPSHTKNRGFSDKLSILI